MREIHEPLDSDGSKIRQGVIATIEALSKVDFSAYTLQGNHGGIVKMAKVCCPKDFPSSVVEAVTKRVISALGFDSLDFVELETNSGFIQ
jgi:hypothetical protein